MKNIFNSLVQPTVFILICLFTGLYLLGLKTLKLKNRYKIIKKHTNSLFPLHPVFFPHLKKNNLLENDETAYKSIHPYRAALSFKDYKVLREHYQSIIEKAVRFRKNTRYIQSSELTVIADRKSYYRFHIIKLIAFPSTSYIGKGLYAVLYKDGKRIKNASGRYLSPFLTRGKLLTAFLNPGYGPDTGTYEARVFHSGLKSAGYISVPVVLKARKLDKIKKGFAVMTLESAIPMKRQRVRSPFSGWGSYRNFFKWSSLLDVDAFWILGSQSAGTDRGISPKNPHSRNTLANVKLLSKESSKHGLKFGAYIISYYTPHGGMMKAGYMPSIGYNSKTDLLYISRHTSLGSKKRFADLVRFAELMNKEKYVDHIGFDFIRTGHSDGYELVDHVVDEMNIFVPSDWSNFTKKKRMRWFARQILVYKNRAIIFKWRWWRAHWVATVINMVKRIARIKKKIWCFTLGWEHGRQHGQDPYMMLDAGCFLDAAMLYEASELQFQGMEGQWKKYIRAKDSNILMGNCVDWKLNPSSIRAPIAELHYRNLRGFSHFLSGGPARGLFWHDAGRAIWGRTGKNDGSEWGIVGASSISEMRRRIGMYPFRLSVSPNFQFKADNTAGKLFVSISNTGHVNLKNIKVSLLPAPILKGKNISQVIMLLSPGEIKKLSFQVLFSQRRLLNIYHVVGFRIERPGMKSYTTHQFIYFGRKPSINMYTPPVKTDEDEDIHDEEVSTNKSSH